jgi:secreted trypsin-like serine protease
MIFPTKRIEINFFQVVVNDILCGGTIVDTKFVLTAAHCLPDNKIKSSQIVAGAHRWCDLDAGMIFLPI